MTGASTSRPRLHRAAVRRRSGAVLSAVRPVAQRTAQRLGLVLWDLEFRHEGGRDVLRAAVDRQGGVDADTIAAYAESLSREIDEVDAVPGDTRYVLEVASPGADRKLHTPEQFRICVQRPVRITFKDGREPMEGTIAGVSDDELEVDRGADGVVRIPFEQISRARLSVGA